MEISSKIVMNSIQSSRIDSVVIKALALVRSLYGGGGCSLAFGFPWLILDRFFH